MHFSQFVVDFLAQDNLLGHVSYILAITSMIMRAMRWLRFFAILAGVTAFFYYGFIRDDFVSAFWESIYVAVNVVQLFILWFENRESQFNEDERAFVHDALMDLKPVHAVRMVRIGKVETIGEGQRLLTEGESPERLYYALSGDIRIVQDGIQIGTCHRGDFIGEMSFLSRSPASASAVTASECRFLVFERADLAKLLGRREQIRHALHAGVSRNLLAKLNRMNASSLLRQTAMVGV